MRASRVKRPRIKAPDYLAWLHELPCVVTGRRDQIEAAHIRFGSMRHGKSHTGMGEKSSDRWALPLTADEHRKQHSMNEIAYWNQAGIDPLVTALALFGCFPDLEMAEQIIASALIDDKRG